MCDFPARQLLTYANEMVATLDPSDDAKLVYALGFIKAMKELNAYHEDLTGCQCWYDAAEEVRVRKPVASAGLAGTYKQAVKGGI